MNEEFGEGRDVGMVKAFWETTVAGYVDIMFLEEPAVEVRRMRDEGLEWLKEEEEEGEDKSIPVK